MVSLKQPHPVMHICLEKSIIMKFRGPVFFSILLLGVLFSAFYPIRPAEQGEKEAVLIRYMLEGLKQLHYQPQTINDNFSEKVYDLYLDRVDSGLRWLTQEDIAKL